MLKNQYKFSGIYKDGKAIPDKPAEVVAFFKSQLGRFEATFEKESEDIVQRQRGYFYGVVVPTIAKVTGYTEEEVVGVTKKRHLTANKGLKTEYVRSETTLTKEEFAKFIDLVIKDAANCGIIIPEPSYRKPDV
jgi:hypothetical protein